MSYNQFNPQQSAQYTDKEMLNDLLNTEKHVIGTYGTNISEASTEELRQSIASNLSQSIQDQFAVFQKMSQHGWYQTKTAPMPEVQNAHQMMTQTKNEIGQ